MGSVWLTIPSVRPPEEAEKVLKLWRERGYQLALWRDDAADLDRFNARIVSAGAYPGYAVAVNTLIADVLKEDPHAEWFVIGGDDVEPDPNHSAKEIAEQCRQYFRAINNCDMEDPDGFGVMQPTGDRWGDSPASRQRFGENRGAYIDRVCGSAWIGREFAMRMYGGKGPLWPEYFHMYADEELQEVALKMGVLWQRRDLTQFHNHWGRQGKLSDMPKFLEKANAEMNKFKQVFEARKQKGFPGHE